MIKLTYDHANDLKIFARVRVRNDVTRAKAVSERKTSIRTLDFFSFAV